MFVHVTYELFVEGFSSMVVSLFSFFLTGLAQWHDVQ